MKIQLVKSIFLMCTLAIMFACNSCNDPAQPPEPTNEEELITTLKIEFRDSSNGQLLNYFFRDPDGEGANAPTQWDTIKLSVNRTYTASVKFLNESNPNSIINITEEIKAEQNNHIICYTTGNNNPLITRTDSAGIYLLGLGTRWVTGTAASGEVTITLKHQPGIKNGTCDPGETDVEVRFPIIIK